MFYVFFIQITLCLYHNSPEAVAQNVVLRQIFSIQKNAIFDGH